MLSSTTLHPAALPHPNKTAPAILPLAASTILF